MILKQTAIGLAKCFPLKAKKKSIMNDSANDEERSMQHIEELFDRTRVAIESANFGETFRLREILHDFALDEPLALTDIHRAKIALEALLRKKHFSPFGNPVVAPISMAAYRFFDGLRRYHVSEDLRRDMQKNTTFRSAAKRQKVDVYNACRAERAFACEKYRALVDVVKHVLVEEQSLSLDDRVDILRAFSSPLQCEQCGRGSGQHKRPGLIIENAVRSLQSTGDVQSIVFAT